MESPRRGLKGKLDVHHNARIPWRPQNSTKKSGLRSRAARPPQASQLSGPHRFFSRSPNDPKVQPRSVRVRRRTGQQHHGEHKARGGETFFIPLRRILIKERISSGFAKIPPSKAPGSQGPPYRESDAPAVKPPSEPTTYRLTVRMSLKSLCPNDAGPLFQQPANW
jgi:hypothetical protein